jgi:hypothetical protein
MALDYQRRLKNGNRLVNSIFQNSGALNMFVKKDHDTNKGKTKQR